MDSILSHHVETHMHSQYKKKSGFKLKGRDIDITLTHAVVTLECRLEAEPKQPQVQPGEDEQKPLGLLSG